MEKNVVTQPKATVFTRIFPYLFSKHFYCMIKDSFIFYLIWKNIPVNRNGGLMGWESIHASNNIEMDKL